MQYYVVESLEAILDSLAPRVCVIVENKLINTAQPPLPKIDYHHHRCFEVFQDARFDILVHESYPPHKITSFRVK